MGNNSNISMMLYMLDDIRRITLKGVEGLTKEQLFKEPVPGEFSIGSYLMHLGECDLGWLETLSGEKQSEELKKRVYYNTWFDCGPEDFAPPKEPIDPVEYVNAITEAREQLRKYMMTMQDADLETEVIQKRKSGDTKILKKWIIYHLIEHEAHTRGQMFMLMRMGGLKKKGENN